jgi:hypothetical protein
MSRLTGKGAGSLANAYASIYEAKKEEKKGEDCTAASEKSKHNCAKKVCHEEFGEGTCVHGQHSFPDENGFVSHYDVEFSHGIEKAVPVSEMKVLEESSHPKEGHEGMYDGEQLAENLKGDPSLDPRSGFLGQFSRTMSRTFGNQSQKNAATSYDRSVEALSKGRTGGGNRPVGADGKPLTAAQIAAETERRRKADPNYKPGQGVDSKPVTRKVTGQGNRPIAGNPNRQGGAAASPAPVTPVKPQPVKEPVKSTLNKDQQAVNKEYDRLRKSGDMKGAAAYGRRMAAAGASRSDFKMPTTNTPAPAQKPSVSAQVSDLQAMRQRSQERQKQQTSRLDKALSGIKPVADDVDLFDLVKGHLIDEGATAEEAMQKMISMTQEEILALAENRRAARAAGGYKDDSKKQTDPSKEGFTGISGSIKDIMRQNKEIEARNKKK